MTSPDPAAGVFDTLLVQQGRPVSAPAHLARLATSARALYDVRLDVAELGRRVTAAAGSTSLARIRLDLVPGSEVTVHVTPLDERPHGAWHLQVRQLPGGWGEHKWRDRTALDEHAGPSEDVLLVDEHDQVLESGRGNVFVVRDGRVTTPPLDGRILPGVTRDTVLRLLAREGVGREGPVVLSDLADADEVFVTNAVGGLRPVATSVSAAGDHRTWAEGPVTRSVADTLEMEWRHEHA